MYIHNNNLCHILYVILLFLAMPCGLRDLSFLTRDQSQATAVKAPSPNHWTTREFLHILSYSTFTMIYININNIQ